ncbi:MarR family winged helix-turn-helix transcriptional regulator [Cellulomonas soli]|uniref:MarR family winged helix-turn-helix transcriptional regulator n=1 Tax=Cellulomonas soli TaxID=931535 RepID=UPI003F870E1A
MSAPIDEPTASRDLAATLRDLAWTVHRHAPEVAGFDPLPATELAVLRHVMDTPGITVNELSRHMGLRQSNTSAAVRTLVERGLVAREGSPADRRITHVVPTDLALADHERIAAAWSGSIREALADLAARDPQQAAVLEAATAALAALDAALRAQQVAQPRSR